MIEGQAWNIAIAEFEWRGGLATVRGCAATEEDDAIQVIVDAMTQEDIAGTRVLRLFSEREPSDEWKQYVAQHWPRARVTWGFNHGEDAKMEAALERLLSPNSKPWWKFW